MSTSNKFDNLVIKELRVNNPFEGVYGSVPLPVCFFMDIFFVIHKNEKPNSANIKSYQKIVNTIVDRATFYDTEKHVRFAAFKKVEVQHLPVSGGVCYMRDNDSMYAGGAPACARFIMALADSEMVEDEKWRLPDPSLASEFQSWLIKKDSLSDSKLRLLQYDQVFYKGTWIMQAGDPAKNHCMGNVLTPSQAQENSSYYAKKCIGMSYPEPFEVDQAQADLPPLPLVQSSSSTTAFNALAKVAAQESDEQVVEEEEDDDSNYIMEESLELVAAAPEPVPEPAPKKSKKSEEIDVQRMMQEEFDDTMEKIDKTLDVIAKMTRDYKASIENLMECTKKMPTESDKVGLCNLLDSYMANYAREINFSVQFDKIDK